MRGRLRWPQWYLRWHPIESQRARPPRWQFHVSTSQSSSTTVSFPGRDGGANGLGRCRRLEGIRKGGRDKRQIAVGLRRWFWRLTFTKPAIDESRIELALSELVVVQNLAEKCQVRLNAFDLVFE